MIAGRILVGTGALLLAGSGAAPFGADAICHDMVERHSDRYAMVWHDKGQGCLRRNRAGDRLRVTWTLPPDGNLVAGTGWAHGSSQRTVRYRVRRFSPGSNGYLSLYGWSRDPLVEYYVVEDWGGFVPPGGGAAALAMVTADGGTYRVYRTRRIDQPSIAGRASFDQYWSVRTERRPRGGTATITFARHVAAWRSLGMTLGSLDYQVLAVEGYGSRGEADVDLTSTDAGTPPRAPS